MEVSMNLRGWIAVTQLAVNIVVIIGGIGLIFTWQQMRAAKGIKKQWIEDLTDEIMFYAEYYDNKLNAKGFVPRKKLIPVEVENIPQIREAIRQRLLQEVSP